MVKNKEPMELIYYALTGALYTFTIISEYFLLAYIFYQFVLFFTKYISDYLIYINLWVAVKVFNNKLLEKLKI